MTSHAVPTPITATMIPTPASSSSVVRSAVRQHVGDEARPDVARAAQREVDDAADRQDGEGTMTPETTSHGKSLPAGRADV